MNQFEQKLNLWFDKFLQMKPGQSLEVALAGKRDPQLFIDVCKEFINQGHEDFEFTNDFKYFKRINSF